MTQFLLLNCTKWQILGLIGWLVVEKLMSLFGYLLKRWIVELQFVFLLSFVFCLYSLFFILLSLFFCLYSLLFILNFAPHFSTSVCRQTSEQCANAIERNILLFGYVRVGPTATATRNTRVNVAVAFAEWFFDGYLRRHSGGANTAQRATAETAKRHRRTRAAANRGCLRRGARCGSSVAGITCCAAHASHIQQTRRRSATNLDGRITLRSCHLRHGRTTANSCRAIDCAMRCGLYRICRFVAIGGLIYGSRFPFGLLQLSILRRLHCGHNATTYTSPNQNYFECAFQYRFFYQ